MTVSRACNVGPVPPVDESRLVNGMKSYIDDTPRDADVFEWGILAGVSKGGGVPYQGIADQARLVTVFLDAAPAARITDQMMKRAFNTAIAAKNMRAIFPHTPRLELVKILCRTVAMGSNQNCFIFFIICLYVCIVCCYGFCNIFQFVNVHCLVSVRSVFLV